MKINFHNQGQSLIGIIIILVVVGLISGGLYYYYLQKQIPEVSEIPEKPKEEVVPSEEIAPPEEVVPPKEEIPTEEVKPEITCQNECSPTGSKKCSNDGYQICGNYDADNCLEWSTITNCPACQYCQGATGSCVNRPNNTQDTTSPNTCSATCKKCFGGACVNQASGENLFSQCTGAYSCSGFVTRLRNMCNGSGACANIDVAASDCSGTCSSYCSGGSCISTNTGAGTCTVATDVRVASGGDGHCASGNCVADYACDDSVTFIYKGSSVTYGIVESQSECWMDRNLGASRKATAYNDSLAYGDLFQWGRLDDGHQTRYSGITTTLSNTDLPGHSNFIYGMGTPFDWRSPQNDNLWQGVSGTNNPCPSGWRIPTEIEWETERLSWSSNDYNGAFASLLKLTVGGRREHRFALHEFVDVFGYYRSSTVSGMYARTLSFNDNLAYMGNRSRAVGFSVRCIKD